MAANLYRTFLRALLLSLTVMLAQTLLAQESPISALPPAPGNMAGSVEIASLDHLPSAPAPVNEASTTVLAVVPPAIAPAIAPVNVHPKETSRHSFWDRENRLLFSAVGALAAADFYSTRANLASGGKELNPVTRVFAGSTPALAVNFALETGGVMAASYLFHKTGHHRLERITSFVSLGSSAAAVGYDLTHR